MSVYQGRPIPLVTCFVFVFVFVFVFFLECITYICIHNLSPPFPFSYPFLLCLHIQPPWHFSTILDRKHRGHDCRNICHIFLIKHPDQMMSAETIKLFLTYKWKIVIYFFFLFVTLFSLFNRCCCDTCRTTWSSGCLGTVSSISSRFHSSNHTRWRLHTFTMFWRFISLIGIIFIDVLRQVKYWRT